MIKTTSIILAVTLLCSCYSTKPLYTGNVHSQALGKTKNQILRTYGLPQRTESDGANGSVLVYEKSVETTVTNVGTNSSLYSGTNSGAIYNSGGIIAGSRTRANVVGNTNAVTRRSVDVQYCYLFLDSALKVYDFKSNYGAEYNDFEKCFDRGKTNLLCTESCLTVLLYPAIGFPSLLIAPAVITWAIIAKKKAMKKGIPVCY